MKILVAHGVPLASCKLGPDLDSCDRIGLRVMSAVTRDLRKH